ncbi:MAG: hypothetical protein ABIK90_05600 [candidate division WOR-3 bacterium]
MKRMIKNLFFNFGFIFSLSLSAQQQTLPQDTIFYFIKEFPNEEYESGLITNVVAIIEVITSSQDTSFLEIPAGFRYVTLEELHNMGILSPSESQDTTSLGELDFYVEDRRQYQGDKWAVSWIRGTYVSQTPLKCIYCGSETYREWWPGRLWLRGYTYRNGWLVYDSGPIRKWGWSIKCVYRATYPQSTVFHWCQEGFHRWNGPYNPPLRTLVGAEW